MVLSNGTNKNKKKIKIPLAPMGVLAPVSAHAGHSAQPPIDTSGNFPARVSAESISPNFPVKIGQSRARLKQDSQSRPFWCSHYPLGWQDSNWKYLVSFSFSIYSFVKSRSCLVFKKFTLALITNLDILGQIVGNKCYFRFKQNLSFF